MKWISIVGFGNVSPLIDIAETYGIHRLALEDTLSPGWRTKLEEHGGFAFFLLQAPPDVATHKRGDHLGLFCRAGLIITFEKTATRIVDALWESLQKDGMPAKITI
jgi:Mg2+ and Co2+ transporter CorA